MIPVKFRRLCLGVTFIHDAGINKPKISLLVSSATEITRVHFILTTDTPAHLHTKPSLPASNQNSLCSKPDILEPTVTVRTLMSFSI